jgi:hypothetical protein
LNVFNKSLILFTCSLLATVAQSQTNEEKAVKTTIETLFKGMKTGDSSLVRGIVMNGARIEAVLKDKSGKTVVKSDKIDGFIKAIGTPHKEIWDERVSSIEIKIDGELATAWTPYHFYLDQKPLHCGANAFQLVKTTEGWKIWSIIDTRRNEDCK